MYNDYPHSRTEPGIFEVIYDERVWLLTLRYFINAYTSYIIVWNTVHCL